MRLVFVVALFVFLSPMLFAQNSNLTCQYTFNTTEQVEKLNVYDKTTNTFVTNSIRIENSTSTNTVMLKLYNDYDVWLTVRVIFDFSPRWFVGGWATETHDSIITIPPRNFQIITEGRSVNEMIFQQNTLKIIFQNNNETFVKYEKENVTNKNCKLCNGSICLNDGVLCKNSIDCGSNFCIRNRCSPDKNCYLNDCECENIDQIQCRNDSCVQKRALAFGAKTSCGLNEECLPGLVTDANGTCIKTEQTLQIEREAAEKARQEKNDADKKAADAQSFVGVIAVIGILVGGYLHRKQIDVDGIKAQTKLIQMKINANMADIENKNREIASKEAELIDVARRFQIEKLKLEKRIASIDKKEAIQDARLKTEYEAKRRELESDLNRMISDFETQRSEVENAKKVLEEQINVIEDNWHKILQPFPHPLANNHLVIINPYLGGYYCFYHKNLPLEKYPYSSLLHRWIWKEHHNGEWPRQGYHIHHIDHDKYNNSIDNLEEIKGEEHYELHRNLK